MAETIAADEEFEVHLDALLAPLARDGNTTLLMELPLPPLCNGYGRARRRVAARHGALLVPKRCFSRVLGHPQGTLNRLHLSAAGHEMMAATVSAILASPAPSSSAK